MTSGAVQPRIRGRVEKVVELARHWARARGRRDALDALAQRSAAARAVLAFVEDRFSPAERRMFAEIDRVRAALYARTDSFVWQVEDPVDPSVLPAPVRQVVGEWARLSSVKPHWGRLLYSLVREVRPETCVELGACFGISGLYVQAAQRHTDVGAFVTFEGSRARSEIARETYGRLGFTDARIVVGDFDRHLVPVLGEIKTAGLTFVDGNHRLEPTLRYDALLRAHAAPGSVIVHDDIRWSAEMIDAWGTIAQRPGARAVLDAFRLGIVELGDDLAAPPPGTVEAWLGWSILR